MVDYEDYVQRIEQLREDYEDAGAWQPADQDTPNKVDLSPGEGSFENKIPSPSQSPMQEVADAALENRKRLNAVLQKLWYLEKRLRQVEDLAEDRHGKV